jgi:hypothetical protein
MPWFKVDDHFHSHPKILATTPAALGLWVVAGSWAAANPTDGFVPLHVLTRLLPDWEPLAAELVDRKLWHRSRGGYKFHDWAEFQPTKEEVEHKRKADTERQRRRRARINGQVNGDAVTAVSQRDSRRDPGVSHATPTRPDPTISTSSSVRENAEVSNAENGDNVHDLNNPRGPRVTLSVAKVVRSYTSRVRPADAPKISGLITNAMADWTIEQAATAVEKLAKDRRPFTAETFRFELEATGPDRTGVTYGRDGSKRAPNGVVRNRAGEIIGGGGPGTGKTLWWGS